MLQEAHTIATRIESQLKALNALATTLPQEKSLACLGVAKRIESQIKTLQRLANGTYRGKPQDPRERFLRHCGEVLPNGCIPWKGAVGRREACPLFSLNSRQISARIAAWELFADKPMPEKPFFTMKCMTPLCVNWRHMRPNSGARTLESRFWEDVGRADEKGCWIWYGEVRKRSQTPLIRAGKSMRDARRVSWELAEERVLGNRTELLPCIASPLCVNPEHLDPNV